MLYLVATPLGNLKDISFRAIEVLKQSSYILCEDTRHSRILLNHYAIETPTKSYHRFNEKEMEKTVLQDLRAGKEISLITDAGTPGISDPGESLIRRCYEENLPFTAIPGPSAWVVALSLSPFSKERVQFLGFLPKKPHERARFLASALSTPATSIFYETPHQLIQLLKTLDPTRRLCILRELTKKFEEHKLGTPHELLSHFEHHPPKGEFVVIVEGTSQDFSTLTPQEHVLFIQQTYNLTPIEAIKIVADLRHLPKSEIYKKFHSEKKI